MEPGVLFFMECMGGGGGGGGGSRSRPQSSYCGYLGHPGVARGLSSAEEGLGGRTAVTDDVIRQT